MSKTTQIKNFAAEMNKILGDYSQFAINELKEAVSEAGKSVKKEIKSKAPKRTGKYKKSWQVQKRRETRTSLSVVVHANGDQYRLTHLLEYGHAKRGGGRVRAIPHIAPAEEAVKEQLIRDLENKLQNH